MTQTPDNISHWQPEQGMLAVPSFMRVGVGEDTRDMFDVHTNQRRFLWLHQVVEIDADLAKLGRWDKYVDSEGRGLIIPRDTRSAASVLSGMEAFPGEKREVVQFLGRYAAKVHKAFGAIDEGLRLGAVGVTRGNGDIFVLPPHHLQTTAEKTHEWLASVDEDLSRVLSEEGKAEELIEIFRNETQSLRGEA